jgi:hypothetical protein
LAGQLRNWREFAREFDAPLPRRALLVSEWAPNSTAIRPARKNNERITKNHYLCQEQSLYGKTNTKGLEMMHPELSELSKIEGLEEIDELGDSSSVISRPQIMSGSEEIELIYRFPKCRTSLEITPDLSKSFGVRVQWHKGKNIIPHFETSPLRTLAQVVFAGQQMPVFMTEHTRKGRDKVLLSGFRKVGSGERSLLRFEALVEGRDETFTWHWRFRPTQAALDIAATAQKKGIQEGNEIAADKIVIALPFASGNTRILTLPATVPGIAVWMNDIVATIVPVPLPGETEGRQPTPTLGTEGRSVTLTLESPVYTTKGVELRWETIYSVARTEADAYDALRKHQAQFAEVKRANATLSESLMTLSDAGVGVLRDEKRLAKRGMDRWAYRIGPDAPTMHGCGAETETAYAVNALLARFLLTGEEPLKRQARLLAYGISEFQVSNTESSHWGAIWDSRTGDKHYHDAQGGESLSFVSTARTIQHLYRANQHLDADQIARVGQAGAQWVLLRTDILGLALGEYFTSSREPQIPRPWITGEGIGAFVETFRASNNETYIKAAVKSVRYLESLIREGKLSVDDATTEQLVATIEGVLATSAEYENEDMITFAKRLGRVLQNRALAGGGVLVTAEPAGGATLRSTLAGIQGALALTRVDKDTIWLQMAVRGLQYVAQTTQGCLSTLPLADIGTLTLLPLHLMLAIASVPRKNLPNFAQMRLHKGWQKFSLDHNTRDYITVTTPEGKPVDHMSFVCPSSLQVILSVLAPPSVESVLISKNQKKPYVTNLLTGEFDLTANLIPLGDTARIGVFSADT